EVVVGHVEREPDGIPAHHEKIALGEVDDVQHAKQQGQARGNKRQRRPDNQAVEELQQDLTHPRDSPSIVAASSSGLLKSLGRKVPTRTPRSMAYSRAHKVRSRSNEESTTSTVMPDSVAVSSACVIS